MLTKHVPRLAAVCIVTMLPIRGSGQENSGKPWDSAMNDLCEVVSWNDLRVLAKSVAENPYVKPGPAPESLTNLTYDDYIKISFRDDRSIWLKERLPFWMQTYHQGFVQRDSVELFELSVTNDQQRTCKRIPFTKSDFDFGDLPPTLPESGHAGLKICGKSSDGRPREMLSFLGSSYFRACSDNTVYGASSRGLAVDIALNKNEEFPKFRAFWIEKPSRTQDSLVILGLLDSPSVAGAYRFCVRPLRRQMQIDVECELFFRASPDKVAYAPITSMWMWGDGLSAPSLDLRPSVHDSDGLLIHSGDSNWKWRPLTRQAYPSVSSTRVDAVHGFGLMQRDRDERHFQDSNALYHRRPSVWVEPKQPWRNGKIELLEIPGAHEGIDSIGAYFVPDRKPETGESRRLEYTIEFSDHEPETHDRLLKLTSLDVDYQGQGTVQMELRFEGASQETLSVKNIDLASEAMRGQVTETKLSTIPNGILAQLLIETDGDGPVELEWVLRSRGRRISETVGYLLSPRQPEFVYPAVYTRQEE